MSAKIPYWILRAARVCPNAARLGRIAGEGSFAVLSCKQGESRHVRLFLDQTDANRAMWKMDRDGCGTDCTQDHRFLLIDEIPEHEIELKETSDVPKSVPAYVGVAVSS